MAARRTTLLCTALRLELLPDCGVDLALPSGHQAAHRFGIGGSTLAACVQVWRLPAAFDAEQVLVAEPPSLIQPGSWLVQVDGCGSPWTATTRTWGWSGQPNAHFLYSSYVFMPIFRYRLMLAIASVLHCLLGSPDFPFCAVCSEFTRAQGSASAPRHSPGVVPAG